MKLLYITNGINGAGGLERVLSIKASTLAAAYDYTVSILVLNEPKFEPFYNFSSKINVVSTAVSGNPASYFKAYKNGIQKVVNQFQPDIISVCDDGLKGFILPSIIKTRAKWVYERHVSKLIDKRSGEDAFNKIINSIKWKIMDTMGRKFDSFVVLTEGNKKEWPNFNNLKVIPNPLSFFPDADSTIRKKRVICVGKISFHKGQDLLLKIWAAVSTDFPEWELHIYGNENIDFLDTTKLPSSVKHFSPEKNIEEKYLESSIYAMSSRFEGFGMVLIEAMACGIPCVSFDCPYGPSDIITDNEDGYLIPPGDLDLFCKKLSALMNDAATRENLGIAARMNVKRFAVNEVMKRWDNLFSDLHDVYIK